MACSIPDLSLDGLGINLNGSSRKFDADGGLGIQVELVTSESTQKVGLADSRVSDQDDCIRAVKSVSWDKRRQRGLEGLRTFEEELVVKARVSEIIGGNA